MEKIVLKASKRGLDQPARIVRDQGFVPGICYGAGKDNIPVQMDYQVFKKAYVKAGENTVIELDVDGEKHNVLVQHMQIDPIYNTAMHVDFIILNMKENVDTHVPIVLVGEAPAVKELGGTLNHILHELEVRCLPGDIPHEFTIDISSILDFHTSLHVSDLQIPSNVELLTDSEVTIVNVSAPAAEEEAPELTPEEQEKAVIEAANAEADADAAAGGADESSD